MQFDIQGGNKAVVHTMPEETLLKPIAVALDEQRRAILMHKPDEKWGGHSKHQKELEVCHAARLLDSLAYIASFFDEPGAKPSETLPLTTGATGGQVPMAGLMCTEGKCVIVKQGDAEARQEAALIPRALPLDRQSTTRALTNQAAAHKAGHGMSLAEVLAAPLANEKKPQFVTGFPESKPLERELGVN